MRSDQFNGEDPQNIRPEWRGGQPGEGPYILRVQLTAALASGGNATAKVLDYTGAALFLSDRVITVYDALRLKSGAAGDKYWAMWNIDARRWEVLGDSGEKVLFRNGDATEAPAYANMQIADPGVSTVDGVQYLDVIKPDGDYIIPKPVYLLNGGSAVPSGETGVGYLAHEIPRRVAYNAADGTPAFGEIWGTYSSNEWEARKGKPGYFVLGNASGGSFLGVKDTEVRAVGGLYKTGAITETTSGKSPVELTNASAQFNTYIDGSAGNYKITILIAGTYLINAALHVKANYVSGPKGKVHVMNVLKNGGAISGGLLSSQGSTYEVARTQLSCTGFHYLEIGDELTMSYSQDDTTDNSQTVVGSITAVRVF